MPASTVTVRAFESNAMTLSCDFNERNSFELSAMSLKQWRVPRTFSLLCALTKSRTSSGERAEYNRSVPYARLPAQLVNFSDAQAKTGESSGLAAAAEQSRMKVRFVQGSTPEVLFSRSFEIL